MKYAELNISISTAYIEHIHVYTCKFDVNTPLRYSRHAQSCFDLHKITMLRLHKLTICWIWHPQGRQDKKIFKLNKSFGKYVQLAEIYYNLW